MGNATSIFNLMRNIGGSVGIAIMTTFLARRTQMHQNRLAGNITASSLQTGKMLRGMQAWFHVNGVDNYVASRRAWAALYGMVQQHASMLSFVESFWLLGVIFLVMLPFILLLRYSPPKAQPEGLRPGTAAGQAIDQPAEVYEKAQEEEELLLVH